MSLLLNEDFSTYILRQGYLNHIHDGVGERLISLNTSVLNNPAFRAAGWIPDNAAVRRCHSPPIPTSSAAAGGVGAEYFQTARSRFNLRDDGGDGEQEDGELGGGMVTGERNSEDTIGVTDLRLNERKRRRTRKEQLEEDDSSDLSDEDSESDGDKTAAQSIKFSKMPYRGRSKSSPPPSRGQDRLMEEDEDEEESRGPEVLITSPSKPPENGAIQFRPRGSSLSAQFEIVKQRARRDTASSSNMSSESEQGTGDGAFNRKIPGRPEQNVRKTVLLADRIQEEDQEELEAANREGMGDSDMEDDDVDEASDLSEEFEAAADGDSPAFGLLGLGVEVGRASTGPSPLKAVPSEHEYPVTDGTHHHDGSPKKKAIDKEHHLPKLARLPSGRPASRVPAASLISMALKGGSKGAVTPGEKPFQRFADLSGKGESSPLWIKIYAPFSKKPSDPIEVPLRRTREGNPVTVAELIGLALWRYNEEDYQPRLTSDEKDSNINRWDLRIVEDDEVDFDFPALVRTRPVTDFTSNNNRPPQRRARDKPWDEFGLVRATEQQYKTNEDLTPAIGGVSTPQPPSTEQLPKLTTRPDMATRSETQTSTASTITPSFNAPRNPITGPSFASSALRKETGTLALDAPQRETVQSTPRTGAAKNIIVQFTDPQSLVSTNITIPTTADTYIAEIFDHACQKLGQEKGLYVLKVHGTQTVAPLDRTVEALGNRLHLQLVRRRFIGAGDGIFGLGLSGSPGSSSPNAPLELAVPGTPGGSGGKKRKGFTITSQPQPANFNLIGLGLALPSELGGIGGKKYNVLRKQPLSFAPSHPRTLIITPEYMQILPAAPDSLAAPTGKVTNVPMTSVVGVKVSRKHPKMVRVLVYRERETKRYDFEAGTKEEASAIVADVRKALEGGYAAV